MKNPVFFILFTLLLQACNADFSEKIEGIKWTDNFSKLGGSQAYTSFINGNVLSCAKNDKQWIIIASYEINGNNLTLVPSTKNKEKKLFEIAVTGIGDNRVLTMTRGSGEQKQEMKFPVSTSNDCPFS